MKAVEEINCMVKQAWSLNPLQLFFRGKDEREPMDSRLRKALGNPIDYFAGYRVNPRDPNSDIKNVITDNDETQNVGMYRNALANRPGRKEVEKAIDDHSRDMVAEYVAATGNSPDVAIAKMRSFGEKITPEQATRWTAPRQNFENDAKALLTPLRQWKDYYGQGSDHRISQLAGDIHNEWNAWKAKNPSRKMDQATYDGMFAGWRRRRDAIMAPKSSYMAGGPRYVPAQAAGRAPARNVAQAKTAPAANPPPKNTNATRTNVVKPWGSATPGNA